MPIANFSTVVAVDKTLGEIQKLLANHGAKGILINYDGQGTPTGVSFTIATQFGDRTFRLPSKTEGVYRAMEREYDRGRIPSRYVTKAQAERVAWRIIREWLRGQLSLIEADIVDISEIMLPYLIQRDGQTLYQVLADQRLALPAPEGDR